MRRAFKVLLIVLGALVGLVIVLVIAALIVIQTPWFHHFVAGKAVAAIEDSTGGKASIGNFSLSLTHLAAEVDDFVLHGTEGPGEPPLFRARSILVSAKIYSLLKRQFGIESLTVNEPQAYVRVAPNGTTNIPKPKKPKPPSNKNPLQTVVDLAVRHVALNNGLIRFADRKTPFNVRGDNLRAVLVYHALNPSYTGSISMTPVYLQSADHPALPVNVNIPLQIGSSSIAVNDARFDMPQSSLRLSASVDDLNAPRGSLRLNGRLVMAELARSFDPSLAPQVHSAPPVTLAASAGVSGNRAEILGLQVAFGRSNLNVSGALDDLKNMNGSLRFDGRLVLAEIGRILNLASRPSGIITLDGNGKLAGSGNYTVSAKIDGRNLEFQNGARRLTGIQVGTRIEADPRLVAVRDLRLAALGGTFSGAGELQRASQDFRFDGALRGFDLRDLAQTYASPKFAWDGTISGPVHATGSLRAPVARRLVASARLGIAPGHRGVPLSGLLDANYNGPRDVISLGNSYIALPHTRLSFSGAIGNQLNIDLLSRDLNDFLPALAMTSPNPPQSLPVTLANGTASFKGTVTGPLSDPRVTGHAALTSFALQKVSFAQFAADLNAAKNGAAVRNLTLSQGKLQVRADASVGLHNWKPQQTDPVSAHASIQNADIRELLALAGKSDIQVSGTLNAGANVSGTVGNPAANANVALTKGKLQDEPYDRIQANVDYSAQAIQLSSAEVVLPAGRIDASGAFQHAANDFKNGRVQFRLASSPIDLGKLHTLQRRKPGLGGTVQLNADGAGALQSAPGKPAFVPETINARISADAVDSGRHLGNLLATANTRGQNLVFNLQSDVADAKIRGDGTLQLSSNYPLNAKMTFSPVRLNAVRGMLAKPGQPQSQNFDAMVEGDLTASGPLMTPHDLKAALRLTKMEVTAAAPRAGGVATAAAGTPQPRQNLALRNQGPIVIELDRQVVRIQSARLVGPSTSFNFGGTVNLAGQQAVDVRADGDVGLGLVQMLDPDVFAAGDILLNAAVQGRLSQPAINGKLQLRNASVNVIDVTNGLSNANGTITFNGAQALIQNITGETGGGKITLAGLVRYGGPEVDFRLKATADKIRVRPSGQLTTQLSSNLNLSGTTKNSLLSGNVTIENVALHSHTDFGSMLSQTAAPPRAPAAQTGMLAGMRLDVHIDTAPGILFESTLAQNLQAEAHLRLRGTPAMPGMLGRVIVSQGNLVLFGNKYTVTEGLVNFYNPVRILPVLAVALETKTKGVTVDLMVRGPMDHLKLTYRSDPPMQFTDIVSLLATGKVPTTDPVLAAQQPPAPQQNMEQMGASAVLSQAVAAPVSGRLQRLFGVTKLKIDPQIIGPENTPQARLTLEQQITKDLNFTYIQDLQSSNPQTIRIEWALDPIWSAIATRQPDGQFGVDFYYKKNFR